jgi:hypothetical protein
MMANGPSLDHLVGARKQRRWHVEAERLGGREVDHELKFGRLHDRQLRGLGTFEDFAGIDASLAIRIDQTSSIAHQAASRSKLASVVNCWQPMTRRQRSKLSAAAGEKCITAD